MAIQAPKMLVCPRCTERGVYTPLSLETNAAVQYKHRDSPTFVAIGGVVTIECNREVRGKRCGYQIVVDKTLER